LEEIAKKVKFIFTVEDGIREGGLGSAVIELLNRQVTRIGVPDEFVPCGKRAFLLDKYGLTASGIADKIKSVIKSGA
jgi:1-deoxy-D-xylulose-5-phosphate synthase